MEIEYFSKFKKDTSGPWYWNVSVLVNFWTFRVSKYCPKMWYLRSLKRLKTCTVPGVLNFHFGISVRPEVPTKKELRELTTKFGVLKNWFFPIWGFRNWNLTKILGLRTDLSPNFETFKCKFSKKLWFQAKIGSWGTERFWNGVS